MVGKASGRRMREDHDQSEQHAAHVERRRRHRPPPRRAARRQLGRRRRIEPGGRCDGVGAGGRAECADVGRLAGGGGTVVTAPSSCGRLTGGGAAARGRRSSRRRAARRWHRRRGTGRRACRGAAPGCGRTTSSTSGMLWLISTTATPWSATRRTSSSTLPVWRTPRAAVGSSMKITLLAHITERQIATLCFWPPDSAPTGASRSLTSVPIEVNASPACSRIALLVEHAEPAEDPGLEQLASGERVLRRAELGGEGEVLVHGLDPEVAGLRRRAQLDRLAVESDRALGRAPTARTGS